MVRFHPDPPHMDHKKYNMLLEKKKLYQDKLTEKYKHFRGVIHESADSEVKYTTIKVYEGFIESLEKEMEAMRKADEVEKS